MLPIRHVIYTLAAVLCLSLANCKPSASKKETIQNKGSDTMIELGQAWAEAYHDADVEISGGGSGVGISSLIAGTVHIANSSRVMTADEIAKAKAGTGKEPVEHIVGYDALAIYVHKTNPLEEISLEQLAQIYGNGGTITKWSDLGVKLPGCESDEITCLSRQNNSGTYEYFKEAVLGKERNYRLGTIDASGSKDLVQQVAQLPCAIGYSGMGYRTDQVKVLRVKKGNGAAAAPSIAAVHQKTYAISRPLYMYTLGHAEGAIGAYITWVRSAAGQKIVADTGYVPLPEGERGGTGEPVRTP
jgi:phosphate transport system substrate-binding protein